MKRIDPKGRLGALVDVKVLERGPGGRASKVSFVGTLGTKTLGPELTIRRALGRLKSTLFHISLKRRYSPQHGGEIVQAILIEGAGFGHGVGMCQNGAVGMSSRGISTEQILKHYFNDATVRRLY
jgi:SpoIID/LytB domain protein